jgi:hypothetical protein
MEPMESLFDHILLIKFMDNFGSRDVIWAAGGHMSAAEVGLEYLNNLKPAITFFGTVLSYFGATILAIPRIYSEDNLEESYLNKDRTVVLERQSDDDMALERFKIILFSFIMALFFSTF